MKAEGAQFHLGAMVAATFVASIIMMLNVMPNCIFSLRVYEGYPQYGWPIAAVDDLRYRRSHGDDMADKAGNGLRISFPAALVVDLLVLFGAVYAVGTVCEKRYWEKRIARKEKNVDA